MCPGGFIEAATASAASLPTVAVVSERRLHPSNHSVSASMFDSRGASKPWW